SVLIATLAQNTQVVHSRLAEGIRLNNPLAQAPFLGSSFSLSTPSRIAALNAEVTRQAVMVAYIDDFKLIMLIALGSIPLLFLLRQARPQPLPTTVATSVAAMTSQPVRSQKGSTMRAISRICRGKQPPSHP